MVPGSAVLLVLGLQANLTGAEDAVDRLVTELGLAEVPTLRYSDPIAVVAPDGQGPLAEHVIGRLRRLGVRRVFFLTPDDAQSDAARDRGARWVLALEPSVYTLHASLRQIDGGLWRAAEPGIAASATVPVVPAPNDPPLPEVAEPVGPNPEPGLYGPAKALARLSGRPLALAVCPLEANTVAVLTRTHLYRATVTNRWQTKASLPLLDLKRHPSPSRFPTGALVCTATEVAFASSDFVGGYVVDPTPWTVQHPLDGAPLAASKEGWLLGQLDAGQPSWRRPDGVVVWAHPGGYPDLALTIDGQLRRNTTVLSTSGIGATARRIDSRTVWVRTGLGPWSTPDTLQLGSEQTAHGRPVTFASSVRATALGQFGGDAWTVLTLIEQDGQTSVQALRVVLP